MALKQGKNVQPARQICMICKRTLWRDPPAAARVGRFRVRPVAGLQQLGIERPGMMAYLRPVAKYRGGPGFSATLTFWTIGC
jgi:hypothetical protein